MIKNIGNADKLVRLIAAGILVILVLANVISGTWAIVSLILAGIFILTSFVSFCPLYYPFGIKTTKAKQ